MQHTTFEKPCSETLNIGGLIRKAKRATKEKDFVSALKIYDSILEKFPKNKKVQKYRNDLISSLSAAQIEPNININNTYQKLEELKTLLNEQRYAKAEKLTIELIENFPNEALYWTTLGHIYRNLEKLGPSFQCLEKALTLNANDPEIHLEISDNFLKINDFKNGFKSLKTCLSLDKQNIEAMFRVGQLYLTVKNYDQAIHEFNNVLEIDQNDLAALNQLGILYKRELGDDVKALEYFKRAFELDKTDFTSCNNLSGVLLNLNRVDEALALFEASKTLKSDQLSDYNKMKFEFNHSLLLMALGDTDTAWPLWWKRTNIMDLFAIDTKKLAFPKLDDPEKIRGKHLLVLREQGVGDQIYMLGSLKRFAKDYNCKVILDVEPRLTKLLTASFDEFNIVSLNQDDPQYPQADFWIGYGDLWALQNLSKQHGLSAPYLHSSKTLTQHWNSVLPSGKPRVGIAWRSGNLLGSRGLEYTDLSDWESLLRSDDFNLINLQYSDIENDLANIDTPLRSKLYVPEIDLKDDFENVAAIIKNCDLVIGPSTAVIHQSSALGVETIIYAAKAYRHALGSFMESNEYVDHWYKNTKVIYYDCSNSAKLVRRVSELARTKLLY